MRTNINVPIDEVIKERLQAVSTTYGISMANLIRDTIENFLPGSTVPKEFISDAGQLYVFNKGVPLRAILPFMSSMLGFKMVDDFTINIKGRDYKIDPYPEYSLLCNIKMCERLYQVIELSKRHNEII